ncbi:hypothetical protein JCM24511_10179 [Saitozyma sp. JCM 24511]|nr:hypothetical protein JCM24511_10179 [Saitozyma sp. JCM 24511]
MFKYVRVYVQWVPIPEGVYVNGDAATELGTDFVKVSRFMRDAYDIRQESLQTLDHNNRARPSVLPDPRLFCIDEVFWYIEQPQRWHRHAEWLSGTGGWAAVGKHLRFQPALVRLADDYLLHAFGLRPDETLPLFFAVSIRRGDFPPDFLAMTTTEHYAHAAWEALLEIRDVLGIDMEHIICTTEKRDPEWRAPLVSYGWHFVDHDAVGTSARFGH